MFQRKNTFLVNTIFRIYKKVLYKSFKQYQPIEENDTYSVSSDRDCEDRFKLIEAEIERFDSKSLIDLGSAEGYYVLRSAKECNIFSIGVEADIRRFSAAQAQLLDNSRYGAGFLFGVIDDALVEKLPSYDTVVFMSVLHHFMYNQGVDYCRSFMQSLRTKVGKVMIFEMGQSNETKNDWASKLPDMGENPHEWIKDFLVSCGFSSVEIIGESDSYLRTHNRAIFRVIP